MKTILRVAMMTLLISGCSSDNKTPQPSEKPPTQPTQPAHGNVTIRFEKVGDLPEIAEKSGVCQGTDKRLYIIQDSDQPSDVTVTDVKGKKIGTIKLKATNNDFEAVACSEGFIYVGDIGDGASNPTIYRFPQPIDANATVTSMKLPFTYSDNNENAEGLAVRGGHIYVVSKVWDGVQKVYEIINGKASPILTLPIKEAISDMSISPDGSKILFAQDESDTFHECDWNGSCKAIKTPFSGDHEGVTYLDNGDWVFMSEDESELYRASYVSDTDVVVPGKPEEPAKPPVEGGWKSPAANSKFQIMDEDDGDYVKQLRADTKVVNIELFGTDKTRVANLKAKDVYLVCYYSLSYEAWRPDAKQFPEDAKGKKMSGWDELWPKLEKESLHIFMDKRDTLAKAIGCDAVELDNMDNNNGGNKEIVMNAFKRRVDHAHGIGLAVMAKNTGEYSSDLSKIGDGIFIEEASRYDEVENYLPWKGKFAGFVEYSKSKAKCLDWAQVHYQSNGYFTANYGTCN